MHKASCIFILGCIFFILCGSTHIWFNHDIQKQRPFCSFTLANSSSGHEKQGLFFSKSRCSAEHNRVIFPQHSRCMHTLGAKLQCIWMLSSPTYHWASPTFCHKIKRREHLFWRRRICLSSLVLAQIPLKIRNELAQDKFQRESASLRHNFCLAGLHILQSGNFEFLNGSLIGDQMGFLARKAVFDFQHTHTFYLYDVGRAKIARGWGCSSARKMASCHSPRLPRTV